MKRLLVCMLLLLVCLPALADTPDAGILLLDPAGDSLDLDGDGTPETLRLDIAPGESEDTFTLTVNDISLQASGCYLTGQLYAVPMGNSLCLAVPEYGASDDPYSYIFLYENDTLLPAGGIPALPRSMETTLSGVTAMIRANTLQTWFRPAEFILATGGHYDYDTGVYTPYDPAVVEVPRGYYPVGTVVTLLQDVTLQTSPLNDAPVCALPAGSRAVISASDDLEWLCIHVPSSPESSWHFTVGWLPMSEGYYVHTDNGPMAGSDVFSGLVFAD